MIEEALKRKLDRFWKLSTRRSASSLLFWRKSRVLRRASTMLCWLFFNPPKVFFPLSESKPVLCWSSGRQEWFSTFLWISCIYPRNESNKDDPAYMYDMNNNRRNKAQQVLRTGKGYVWRKLKSQEINSNAKQIVSTSYNVFYIQTQSTP